MDSATQFKLINELLAAIAKLLWPLITIIIILLFRSDLSAILKRLRKGKLFGQEMELDPYVEEFKKTVEEAQEEIPDSEIEEEEYDKEIKETDKDIREILEAAKISTELGVIKLSSILEREIRVLAGSLGQTTSKHRISSVNLFRRLVEKGYLPQHTTKSLQIFWDLRNKIIHGHKQKNERNILKVLDIGLVLLKTIKSIPHEINVIYHSGVDIYSDEQCNNLIPDVKGIILETTSPGRAQQFKRIFPTTRPEYYKKGKIVTWEWDLSRIWDKAWYKDPDTGEIKQAWGSAGEFVGRHIDEI